MCVCLCVLLGVRRCTLVTVVSFDDSQTGRPTRIVDRHFLDLFFPISIRFRSKFDPSLIQKSQNRGNRELNLEREGS